jgi:KDO2-lipid IV(A) lauroyltransferase
MRLSKKIKRRIVWSIARTFDWMLNRVSRPTAIAIGGGIGVLAWLILPKDRHKIDRHLTLAFKDELSAGERRGIGRRFFINSGRNLADLVRFRKYYESEIKALVRVEGLEHLDAAFKSGKGLIGVTGHIGNFELLAAHLSKLGFEIAVIGRELNDPRLDKWLTDNRRAAGLTNFSTTESAKTILSWLKSGKGLGVLVDTDSIRVRGRAIPFFGRPANTPVGPFHLGIRAGSAFLPLCCVREEGNRYLIRIEPPIQPPSDAAYEEAVNSVMIRCTNALEGFIRTWPDQWIWIHNRWHTKPEDVA